MGFAKPIEQIFIKLSRYIYVSKRYYTSQKLYEKIKESDILVNATKSGMKPAEDESLIKDVSVFRTDFVVADAVYNPRETKLIREAKAAGCKIALGGIGMLLWQGEAAFRIFTGESMPTEEMYERFFRG